MRTFRENLIIGYSGQYLMLNLISFRRKIITINQYRMLETIKGLSHDNLSDEEMEFYNDLFNEKQLLSDELIATYDKQREDSAPISKRKIGSITINLTYDCNFKCKYCYQKNFHAKPGEHMTVQDVDKIYSFILNYNALHNEDNHLKEIVISGGESLLDENLDAINHILEKFSCDKFKLFTNGVNIIKFADRIKYEKFAEVQVSLDGTNDVIQELNNNTTAPFYNIIKGILLLTEKGVKVSIISMVTKDSFLHLKDFLKQIERYGLIDNPLISIRFSFVVDYGAEYTLDTSFYNFNEYLQLRRDVVKMVTGKKNISVDRLYDLNFLSSVIYRQKNDKTLGRIGMCKTQEGFPLLFAPDRNIYWCTCTNKDKALLSIDRNPVELDTVELLNELLNRNIYKIDKCKKCLYRFVCSAGCALYAIHSNSSAYSSHCGIFQHPIFTEKAEQFLSL